MIKSATNIVFGIAAMAIAAAASLATPANAQEFRLRFGLTFAQTHPISQGAALFKEQVEKASQGRVSITLYPSGQLGSQNTLQEAVVNGLLDFAQTSASSLEAIYKPAVVLALPFGYRDDAHFRGVIKSDLGKDLYEDMRKKINVRILTTIFQPASQMTSNKPVRSIADFKGLRLRVPPVTVWQAFWRQAGVSPTPIDFAELYTSLQTGIVDAQENPVVNTYNGKLHEVQKYLILTSHVRTINMFMVSEDTFKKMSADIQQAMFQAGEAAERFINDAWAVQDKEAFVAIKKAGIEVISIDTQPLNQVAEDFYKSYLPADIFARYEKMRAWGK
ncbi:TRAP transporter substrate-binding protein [Shumkonia mesophila]|uniref:TRAP transporter substrate-binding protein n=1 Tax=Shumkonia mesophila TaxID=2838854 RepID=UPI002934EDB5|nr:TRAP transporter substrate-binding protein [Shumkonia mesophila]